ncbi:MAG: oligosaccharide flippase family protein [Thermoguttaceae bacterium]|nr:oligosaccharide flippase family protein [Thermoguttaceae bacterium]MDW8078271.1 oligosaccharide flippase family protein [Thermoguttaceae bacterium]
MTNDLCCDVHGNEETRRQLAGRIRRGASAVVLIEAVHQLANLVFLAILYRVLGVDPYGLLAMVVPLLYLARIVVTSGLDVATIQRPELDVSQVSALFWVQQLLGALVTLGVAAAAPVVAWFYRQPMLLEVTAVLAGTNLLATLGLQHYALLQRRLRLGAAAAIRLAAGVSGNLVAIAAAVNGWHVWALVAQMYIELAVFDLLVWTLEPFRPKLTLRGAGILGMIRFGGLCTWATFMHFVATQVDKVCLGYALGVRAAALYSQAYNLASRPVQLVITRLSTIMLPALSRAQEDPAFFRAILLICFRIIAATMFPATVGLALVGPEVMSILGGGQWRPAGPLLAILALTIVSQAFVQNFGTVLAAAGKGRPLALACTTLAALQTSAVLAGLAVGSWTNYPLEIVASFYTGALGLLAFPAYLLAVLQIAKIAVEEVCRAIWPSVRATLLMGMAVAVGRMVLSFAGAGEVIRLAALVGLGVLLYLVLARRELFELARLVLPLGAGSS